METTETDEEAIDALMKLPDQAVDVFDTLGPTDINTLILCRFGHLRKLMEHAVDGMKRFSHGEHHFGHKWVLNCIRFVTRVVSLTLEYNSKAEIRELYWGEKSLALDIVDATMGLCFCSKFTIPFQSKDMSLSELLWHSGLVKEWPCPTSDFLEETRTEVLRCMLACCGEALYLPKDALETHRDPWIWLWSCKDLRNTKALFFSMLNTALSFHPEGWFGAKQSPIKELVAASAHVLILFLHSEIPDLETIQTSELLQKAQKCMQQLYSASEGPLSGATHLPLNQVYTQLVRDLDNTLDFQYIFLNIMFVLKESRQNSYLVEEFLVLLWEFVDLNPNFEAFICSENDAGELFKNIMYYMWMNYKDPQKVGLVQICSFLLLHLSGGECYIVRNFCISLGEPYQSDLPIQVPNGVETLSDLVIVFTHDFISVNPDLLSLASCLITVIRNISAFVKTIGTLASVHITSLFKMFASAKLIGTDAIYLQLATALLDVIDNRVQYHWDGSVNLVYAVLMKREVFDRFLELRLEDDPDGSEKVNLRSVFESHAVSTLKGMFSALDPLFEALEKEFQQVTETEVLSLLAETTLVGQLPSHHEILVHKFRANSATKSWLTVYIWVRCI